MNPGDVCYHKATRKRCVISEPWEENKVRVTTQDGETKVYSKAELWTETEWLEKNRNKI